MGSHVSNDLFASNANRSEIVVVYYNEDLAWLLPVVSDIIVYARGTTIHTTHDHESNKTLTDTGFAANTPKEGHFFRDVIELSNIGRERAIRACNIL